MSTFNYLKPGEAIQFSRPNTPDYLRIVGLKGLSADRIPNLITRTAAGNARKPIDGWRAHPYLHKFKEIARIEWAKDADPGSIDVFYADGSMEHLHSGDLLCVERPI